MATVGSSIKGTAKLLTAGMDAASTADLRVLIDSNGNLVLGTTNTAANIPNVAAGNLAATDVQGALNELQGDLDALNAISAANFFAVNGVPGAGDGADGDYAINVANGDVYGPKAGGAWPGTPIDNAYDTSLSSAAALSHGTAAAGTGTLAAREDHVHPHSTDSQLTIMAAGTNYTGAAGGTLASHVTGIDTALGLIDDKNTIIATGAPGAGVGQNGDYYINATNGDFYGPKAGGTWPASTQNVFDSTLTLTSTVGQSHGTAAAGTSTEAARADHVHPHSTDSQLTITAAGTNYTGAAGGTLASHVTGIDNALAVYQAALASGAWAAGGSGLQYSIPAATHGQGTNPRLVDVYEGTGPYTSVSVLTSIAANGDITLEIPAGTAFDGYIIVD